MLVETQFAPGCYRHKLPTGEVVIMFVATDGTCTVNGWQYLTVFKAMKAVNSQRVNVFTFWTAQRREPN